MANALRAKGVTLAEAFKKAWRRVKESMTMRVSGVSFNGNQAKLAYLARFNPDELVATLKREPDNAHDKDAIKVLVTIPKERKYAELGYIPAAVAGELAKIMDKGMEIKAKILSVIGGYSYKESYGLLINLTI